MFEIDSERQVLSTFEQMVQHFEGIDTEVRDKLAESWGADAASPDALATVWMDHPNRVADQLMADAIESGCAPALADLVLEHSLPLERDWFEPSLRLPLTQLGMIPGDPTGPDDDHPFVFPAGLAAALADRVEGERPSLAVLLGRSDADRIDGLLDTYDLDSGGSPLHRMARIMDLLSGRDALDTVLEQLPNQDWLGPAVMILELGGNCYWREIFGVEADDDNQDEKVVALMGADQRDRERELAERLIDLGVIFRLDESDRPWPMIAVPEELWPAVWSEGREWIAEWLGVTHNDLIESSTAEAAPDDTPDFQNVAKWLACETNLEPLTVDNRQPTDTTRQRLDDTAKGSLRDIWPKVWDLAIESSVLSITGEGELDLGRDADTMLNASSREVASGLLQEWSSGYLGRSVDAELAGAWGLDETWRRQAVELLNARHGFVPVWFDNEGVPQENTGAGCLRNLEDDRMELTLQEVELVNGVVWTAKLLWLDLISLLDSDRGYHEAVLSDLLRMCAAMSVYSRLGDLMHDPRAYFYLPVQRPSLLNSPMHVDEFDAWVADIFDRLFEPLGLVSVDQSAADTRSNADDAAPQTPDGSEPRSVEAGRRIWLETSMPVIDGPVGWPESEREEMLRFILGEDFEWNRNDTATGAHLSAVSGGDGNGAEERLDLSADLQHLLDRTQTRHIVSCDGGTMVLRD